MAGRPETAQKEQHKPGSGTNRINGEPTMPHRRPNRGQATIAVSGGVAYDNNPMKRSDRSESRRSGKNNPDLVSAHGCIIEVRFLERAKKPGNALRSGKDRRHENLEIWD